MKNDVQAILAEAQAVINNSHLVYTSGKHGRAYVNKDALYVNPLHVSGLCQVIADEVFPLQIDAVVAPAIGAVLLSSWTAYHLGQKYLLQAGMPMALYAERSETSVLKAPDDKDLKVGIICNDAKDQLKPTLTTNVGDVASRVVSAGEELVIKEARLVLKRGYNRRVAGKRVLVIDDVLNTGISCKRTIEAVVDAGGKVVKVAAICNRGKVTSKMLGLDDDMLFSLLDVDMEAWPEDQCPLCVQGVPINIEVGHGKAYLDRKRA